MLANKRQNYRHSKLPSIGTIGTLRIRAGDRARKCIVSHFPLCDNVLPYSIGIHTVYVRFLDNGEIQRVSGIWFESWES